VDPRIENFPERDPPCADRVDARAIAVTSQRLNPKFYGKFAVIEGYVLEDGTVGDLQPVGGNDPKLIEYVMAKARQWQFKPCTCQGKPVRQYIRFSIDARSK
jgi:hypothetical protein